MARVNVGINPIYLADQHLVAESVEITMIVGSLRMNGWKIKSEIPNQYQLGKGHINFFKNKIKYLARRLVEVNNEMRRRGFSPGTDESYLKSPPEFQNDWNPTINDSKIVRGRIIEKMILKPDGFWRYQKNKIINRGLFEENILNGDMFYV